MSKKTKVIISLVVVAAIIIGSFATYWIIESNKKFKIGVMPSYPFAYQNEDGSWAGYEIDFATKLFTDLGYEDFVFVKADAVGREQMLADGEIDCYLSGTDIDFDTDSIYSEEYIRPKQVVFYNTAVTLEDINKPEDLNNYRVGVIDDCKAIRTLATYVDNERVLEFRDQHELVAELSNEYIVVGIIDWVYAEYLVKKDVRFKDYKIGIVFEDSSTSIVLPKKKTKLKSQIDEKIKEYKENKYLQTLKEAYFLQEYCY